MFVLQECHEEHDDERKEAAYDRDAKALSFPRLYRTLKESMKSIPPCPSGLINQVPLNLIEQDPSSWQEFLNSINH